MLTTFLVTVFVAFQAPPASTPGAPDGKPPSEWTGCVQAASTPSAFRLNLDTSAAGNTTASAEGHGEPYLQLVPSREGQEIQRFVGKRVRVRGRRLSDAEAQQLAARNPDRQEANESAIGTGGATQRHLAFVRVTSIVEAPGECR